MTTSEYIKALNDIADFYAKNPELKLPYIINDDGSCTIFYYDNNPDKVNFAQFVRALGKVDKQFTTSNIIITSLCPKFKLYMDRGAVCKPLKKEKKIIPAQPAREAYEIEEVTEWDCGSILETEIAAREILALEKENA